MSHLLAYLPQNFISSLKTQLVRTCLVAQWLRLCAPNAGGPGSIPYPGTRSHTQATTKSPHATNSCGRQATTKESTCCN